MERHRATLAALMCASLVTPSAPAQSTADPVNPTHSTARPAYQPGQLHGDQRILQALNRFTFGPRPGDLEAVRAMGLDQWFNQQLHPETLDQSGLNARLAQFPAMQLDPQTLLFRYPSNAIIRQIADGKATEPQHPALRPIYENELARVEQRRQEREQNNQRLASIAPVAAMNSAPSPRAMAEIHDPG